MITTERLSRGFGRGPTRVEAVREIDLRVDRGEVVALLGPNGAGKSTTLRMLTTLLAPSGGRAVVAGHDVAREPEAVRRRIGLVGQGNGSFDGVLVEEELVTQGRFYGLDTRTSRMRSRELLEHLELSEQARQDVARLSGGQRRRLDVAMGLVNRPELLFLDEPTTGLDPQSRSNLWEHVADLREAEDMTIVLTTHYLEEADTAAERVVVIDDGRIIADGTPEELKSTVSGDLVTVSLGAPDEHPSAVAATAGLPGVHDVDVSEGVLTFRVAAAGALLPEVLRALDRSGARVESVRVQRPTLDDVFLNLTGRRLRDGAR